MRARRCGAKRYGQRTPQRASAEQSVQFLLASGAAAGELPLSMALALHVARVLPPTSVWVTTQGWATDAQMA